MINVLDHGYVKFIGSMGSEETIIEAARMSTGRGFERWDPGDICEVCHLNREDAGQRPRAGVDWTRCVSGAAHEWKTVNGDQKLLAYLYQNKHHTPFEMCEMAIEAYWPIMVGREAMRHRVFSFNEFSGRYAQMPNEHYLPELQRFQVQSTANKQGSAEPLSPGVAERLRRSLDTEQQEVYETYNNLIDRHGVAKEVARINTPVSRYTRVRMKGDLRGWLGFLDLRLRPNAQWEIRQYAEAVGSLVKELWPRTHALFIEHTLDALTLSASEVKVMRQFIYDRSSAVKPGLVLDASPAEALVLKKFGDLP